MRPTVVYVHGNGNKPAKDALKDIWDRALFGRDVGSRSRMAYWADLRYPDPLPARAIDELESGGDGEEGVADSDLDPAELVVEALMEAHSESLVETPAPGGGLPAEG